MGDRSAIEWTNATWNPIRGCTRVSEGCRHCYAERAAVRHIAGAYHGLVEDTPAGPRWTGQVQLVEDAVDLPLKWKKPRRIFVNSMSDLFHEKVPDLWIGRIVATMARARQHTFQILTKRPERMAEYFRTVRVLLDDPVIVVGHRPPGDRTVENDWPLPNVWLGVSVEDQATADERIPLLLQTPAAVRWVSYEPALGPVDFRRRNYLRCGHRDYYGDIVCPICNDAREHGAWLDWLVVGGESGPGARPFDLAWARQTIAQCRAAVVPCFVKQLGAKPRGECSWRHHAEKPPVWLDDDGVLPSVSGKPATDLCHSTLDGHAPCALKLRDRKGGDPVEWPKDLRIREYPR